ncbi:M23 family metallopeptidase [Blastococcus saxobsidens]|uniref:Peptidase M23 (Modular protein) n=1 Tax=Blastococcus saxobsidens (strain DD2) TaxID=1146883 RepID=H6RW79_BLASD|nr:M23 family metallopeptidase [Blastococcus saxobsidens]CCG02096.1 Peptidase M23 (modular protein) [Blastococcus saxobsidens DD2]
MSSLHHDRLPEEGAAPADPVVTTATPARRTTRSSTAATEGTAGSPVPPQRQGKVQSAGGRRVAGSTARAVGAAAVGAETAGTKAVTVTTATAEVLHAKATTATPATRKAAGAARTVAAAAKAPAAAKAATAKPAAEGTATRRPTPCKRNAVDPAAPEPGVHRTGLVTTRPATAETALVVVADVPPAAPSPALVLPVPADVARSADAERVVAGVAQGRAGLLARRLPSVRRRPVIYLAAALIGALSVSGASAAPAEVQTRTVSHSVSVAEQLGLEATAPAVVDDEATSHLRGLVASRNARDAERTAAADAQAEADRLAAEEAARIAAEAARPKAVHPVEGARLTSGFGARWGTLHAGVDFAAPMRTPERAAMDGVVLEAGPAAGFGLVVYLQHENGDVTVYGHMDEILVEPGQVVRAGDTIALLGNRGQSTGPHLHFEVRVGGLDGQKVDPLPWLRERGVHI